MPRMSKKRKQDWALFLNERNRITYNELCRKCSNDCKQSFRCIVVLCPMPKKLMFHPDNLYYETLKATIQNHEKEALKNNA